MRNCSVAQVGVGKNLFGVVRCSNVLLAGNKKGVGSDTFQLWD
jgi:hypothetical protein